jgi:hypothetical protein
MEGDGVRIGLKIDLAVVVNKRTVPLMDKLNLT